MVRNERRRPKRQTQTATVTNLVNQPRLARNRWVQVVFLQQPVLSYDVPRMSVKRSRKSFWSAADSSVRARSRDPSLHSPAGATPHFSQALNYPVYVAKQCCVSQ